MLKNQNKEARPLYNFFAFSEWLLPIPPIFLNWTLVVYAHGI
ncbi:hypothetical protein P278_05150 [Zhouia amylolytica AD3]|uniref:Uncharacterized protein n=1 Tax=Zhouia amylolytica AD3 TaxID=1286632 RepID=W2USZ2_9FLAO|nr:hypothetical protein P278_05150 [Zhouia amylolytica AD3]